MHKKQSASSFQPGTTLLELLIGVTIMLLLFGAVLGTLSQGFTAINMSRNKTHAQEANRIALEQTAALVRSSIYSQPEISSDRKRITITRRNAQGDTEPETTIQKSENDSHLVTTGGLNKTIGYNVSNINFVVTPAAQDNGVGYVKIDNTTNADYAVSNLTTFASSRITHVEIDEIAGLAFGVNDGIIYNRTCRAGYTCDRPSVTQLKLTPDKEMAALLIIPQNHGIIYPSQWSATDTDKIEANEVHISTFDGPANLSVDGTEDSKTFTFTAQGTDKAGATVGPKSITVTVEDPCAKPDCTGGKIPVNNQSSQWMPPCQTCECPSGTQWNGTICETIVGDYKATDCKGVEHTSTISQVDANNAALAVVCSCTINDCDGTGHTKTYSSSDGSNKSCDKAQKEADKYFCATTYDCNGDGHLCKRTSPIVAQICADELAVAVQCTKTFDYWIYSTWMSFSTWQYYYPDIDLLFLSHDLRVSGASTTSIYSSTLEDYFILYSYQPTSRVKGLLTTIEDEVEHDTYYYKEDRYATSIQYNYNINLFTFSSPIILDLDGIGVPDVANGDWLPHPDRFDRNCAKQFDMTGEGYFMLTEWVGPQSGLLVTLDENSTVVSALNLFGTAGGWRDGYVKLAALFDKDKNSMVEGNELDNLYVWQDMNMNAKADPGELKTVEEWGITKIWTKHDHYRSLYERNGKKLFTWDWWPSVVDIHEKDRNDMLKGRDLQKHQFINKNI